MATGFHNVTSDWVDGNLVAKDKDGNTILTVDGASRKVTFANGAQLEVPTGDIVTSEIAAGAATPAKLGLAVINKSGSEIAVDKVVAIVGLDATSGKPKIVLADANLTTHKNLWVTTAAIANNAEGTVVKSALSAADLNTNSATTAGDPVYLSETAGGFAHTAPAAPAAAQIIGFVVVKSATVGQILWLAHELPGPSTFISTEQTATGSAQNVAHGLGVAPRGVLVVPTEHPGTPDTGAFDVAEGAHDATNVVVTVTADVKFKVMATV